MSEYPMIAFGDLDSAGVFVHTEDVAEKDLGDEDTVIIEVVLAAKGEGGFDVGGEIGEVEFAVVRFEEF